MTSQFAGHPATQLTAGRGRGPGSKDTALAQRARRCPIPYCGELIDPSRLMCRTHWHLIPKQLRDRVWATWRSGEEALSSEHLEAVRLAITACQVAA
jgi:hypothetical protein